MESPRPVTLQEIIADFLNALYPEDESQEPEDIQES